MYNPVAKRGLARRSAGKISVLTFLNDPHQMADLTDHAAYGRRIFEDAAAMQLVQAQALERCFLIVPSPDRTSGLFDSDRLRAFHYAGSRASASRRPRISPTFLPRRAATARGLVARPSATKVALIILCGLALPIDLATTSCTPSASKIARIGPPAMIPVPGLAARTMTRPAP